MPHPLARHIRRQILHHVADVRYESQGLAGGPDRTPPWQPSGRALLTAGLITVAVGLHWPWERMYAMLPRVPW